MNFTFIIIRVISLSGRCSNIAHALATAFDLCVCAQDLGLADTMNTKNECFVDIIDTTKKQALNMKQFM